MATNGKHGLKNQNAVHVAKLGFLHGEIKMFEVKLKGDWPETAIQDINKAHIILTKFNLESPTVLLIGPRHLLHNLDARYKETTFTYMTILKKNGLIDNNIQLRSKHSEEKFAILFAYSLNKNNFPEIVFETTQIKLTNIRSVRNTKTQKILCPNCGEETEMPLSGRDGTLYEYMKCKCGQEVTIKK